MVIVGNKNPFSDDNIWCYSSQRLLLPELFQHLGPAGGQCVSTLNRHGVSGVQKYTAQIPLTGFYNIKKYLIKGCC